MTNGSKFSGVKRVRLAVLTLALLAALVAMQALGVKPAEAGVCLTCPNSGGPIPMSPSQVVWTGTDASETKFGSNYADTMDARGGDDTLYGHGGNDKLYGGAGNDSISAGGGDDQINVADGADTVLGGDHNDTIIAYADGQPDKFDGGAGTDMIKITSCSLDSTDVLQGIEIVSRPVC